MSAFKHFTKIDIATSLKHVKASAPAVEGCQSAASGTRSEDSRPLTGGTNMDGG